MLHWRFCSRDDDRTRRYCSGALPTIPTPPLGSKIRAAGIGVSESEIACAKKRFSDENLSVIGLRFVKDGFVPDERFDTYKRVFGGKFEAIELDPKDAAPSPMAPHSVLTVHLDDRPGTPTKRAEERVIAFFKERTA